MPNNFLEKFAALSQREKIIIIVALTAGLYFTWDSLLFKPSQKKQQAFINEISKLNTQITDKKIEAIKLESNALTDPNLNNRNKLAELKADYGHLQDRMMQGGKSFVPPHLMATALGDILNQNNQLTLIKLDTLPATTLIVSKQPQQNPIYKHGLEITFSGSYLDTLNYLKTLEALPWHFIWESVNFQVKDYPIAETTIKTYTLSFKESWLGV